jgi:hypothetical protein
VSKSEVASSAYIGERSAASGGRERGKDAFAESESGGMRVPKGVGGGCVARRRGWSGRGRGACRRR